MAKAGQVHWHEGLFLQPHHLQTAQRFSVEQAALERRLAWPYPYGVYEARLAVDALQNMLVQFDRLRLIMPSGIVVDFPDHAELPALDIKSAFQSTSGSLTVSVGVPLWYSERGNVLDGHDDGQAKRLYRIKEIERVDENTGENPQPVPVRRVNARLLLEGQDKTDLETMPLLRIAHGTGAEAGLPRQDPSFVPPCLLLRGSVTLYEQLRDLSNHIEARRGQLFARMGREKFNIDQMRGGQFAQLHKLRTLNHFSSRLSHLVKAPRCTPLELYLELRSLLGELAALQTERDHSLVADYEHDNPAVPFGELISRIRMLLPREGEVIILTVQFVPHERLRIAELKDEHFKRPNEYFLGIDTRQDPAQLKALVENHDRFKLMSRSLARADVWGITLQEVKDPPLQLPKPPGRHYFRLLLNDTPSSARMWEMVQREKILSLKWPDMDAADYQITLFMTVADTEG